jgi:hypothetical protein
MTYTDTEIAKKFLSKALDAERRGLEFNLTLTSFKNMLRAKKCRYSGVTLTRQQGVMKATDITIERIDPNQGYVIGNVCAASHEMNKLKSKWEHKISPEMMIKIATQFKNAKKLAKSAS